MPPSLFWLTALVLVVGTVTALVWPLLRTRAAAPSAPEAAANTDIYRDQKRQLDLELAAGAITAAERDAQIAELTARLGAEIAAGSPPPAQASPRSAYIAALVLVAVIPVSALVLYLTFGGISSLQVATQAGEEPQMSHEQIVAMVEKLATRMKEHPEDPKGWQLLARAYAAMGRFPESVAAFKEAAARSPPDASLLADWADALAMQNQTLQGEPARLVAQALALDPAHPKALSLAATAALERKDYDGAIAEWRKLKSIVPPDGEDAKDIDAMIAEAEAAKRGAPAPPALGRAARGAPATSPATAASAPPDAENASPSAAAFSISGRVVLDPKLRERTAPNDALFIFARAVNGPRMPLAVIRGTAGELPRAFTLDDSMAMTPAARLSSANEVVVEARISKSGSATPSPGDLRGASAPVKPGARDVLITINDAVP
ncbi:MAG: c-type cytochrome biogenesis protein CcmI [Rudaea sp.]